LEVVFSFRAGEGRRYGRECVVRMGIRRGWRIYPSSRQAGGGRLKNQWFRAEGWVEGRVVGTVRF
jgi:hypothetical protein